MNDKDFLLTIHDYLTHYQDVPRRFTEADIKVGMSHLQTDLRPTSCKNGPGFAHSENSNFL